MNTTGTNPQSFHIYLANEPMQSAPEELAQHIFSEYKLPNPSEEKVLNYIHNGANINSFNKVGNSIIHLACRYGHAGVVQVCLENKPEMINCVIGGGYTVLHEACFYGNNQIFDEIVDKVESVSIPDALGCTPLHRACVGGHVEIAQKLIDIGANINTPNNSQYTPLHEVVTRENRLSILQLLLSQNASTESKDPYGRTPLHLAVVSNNLPYVQMLISYNAEINAKDNENVTPLGYALKKGYHDIVDFLKLHGAL